MKDYTKDKLLLLEEDRITTLEEIEMLEFQMAKFDGKVNTKHVGRLMELKIIASQIQSEIDKLKFQEYNNDKL